mgnify:CR=1 FL=1
MSFVLTSQAQELIRPQSYVAHKTLSPLKIDGLANESDWQKTAWTKNFIDIEGKVTPTYQTRAKMLWDESHFYIFVELEEPHVWATLKQNDTIVYYNNDFEVFVDPDGDTHNYYEMEMNALNTIWDMLLTRPYRGGNESINDFDMKGMKTAIHVDGTLNDPTDTDKGWSIEIAIPWSTFKTGYFHDVVPENDFWRVDFSRVNWNFELIDGVYHRKKDKNGKYLHEYNWVWSPNGVINMHEPEKWAYVFFSTKAPGSNQSFEIPKNEEVKWQLYKVYRKHLQYIDQNEKIAKSLKELGMESIQVDGKSLSPKLISDDFSWRLSVKSPYSGKEMIIREDGKFIER